MRSGTVTVHPISCDAAPLGADVDDVDEATRSLAGRIEVRIDEPLSESAANMRWEEPDGRVIETTTQAAVLGI